MSGQDGVTQSARLWQVEVPATAFKVRYEGWAPLDTEVSWAAEGLALQYLT